MAKSSLKTQAETASKAGRKPASKSGSLAEQVYKKLKEKIITLHFLPGQYLNEGALCAMLGVGRTPVHQALQRLELERLVEIMPRKGVIVLPDSIAEIIKILRRIIQVRPVPQRDAGDLASMAQDPGAIGRRRAASRSDRRSAEINPS